MADYEVWPRSFPPRYNPTAPTQDHQPDPISGSIASMNGIANHNFVRRQYPKLTWCSFQVPYSDDLIQDDTREGVPTYDVPNESDGFIVVRRYLYDVLTSTGWGISHKYPAAIRATVEGWYGNGGYFRTLVATEDGLLNLCPRVGRNSEGKEVDFHEKTRCLIRDCVRYETSVLLRSEMELGDTASERTYVDGNAPQHIVYEKTRRNEGKEIGRYPAFHPSLDGNQNFTTAPDQDQRSHAKLLAFARDNATSSQTAGLELRDSEVLASSYRDLIISKYQLKTSSDITHDLNVQVCAPPKDKQSKKRKLSSALPRATDQVDLGSESVIGHMRPNHMDNTTSEPQSRRSFSEDRPSGHKYARCNPTPPVQSPTRVEPKTGSKRSAKTVDEIPRIPLSTTSSISSIKSSRYETLPRRRRPSTKDTLLIDAATTAANKAKALALNVDEARQLNHHERMVERKKANVFSKMLGRLAGKKG